MLFLSLTTCKSTPDPSLPDTNVPSVTPLPDSASDLLAETRGMISIASPEALIGALELLNENSQGESEAGRDLKAVSWFILETLYPFLLPSTDPPEQQAASVYSGLFESVRSGRFPEIPQEDITFLTTLISPIALLYTDSQVVREQSLEVLEQLNMLNSASVLPVYLLGVLAEKGGDFLSALEYYTTAVEMEPSVYPAELGIARIQLDGGQPDKAIINLDRLNTSFPERPEILKLLGEASYLLKDWDRALDLVANTLLLIPDDNELLFLRAKILYSVDRFDQSRRILSIVEREMPGRWDVLHLKALLEVERGDYQEAAQILEKALERNPKNSTLKNTYGEVLIAAGRLEEGRKLLSDQILTDGDNSATEKSLDILLNDAVSSGIWEVAAGYSDQILQYRREKTDLLLARRINLALNKADAVQVLEEELYTAYPDDPEVVDFYARSLINRGENGRAETILKASLESENDFSRRSRLYYLLSITAENEADKIDNLRSALLEDLENTEALMALSAIYFTRRDYRNAYRYVKQAYLLDPENDEIRAEVDKIEELIP
ncbi:MAG: tetratricopeptide repeat protein [Spirochaetales bacterium]|nr:tetratricopeptide repeat protein [Spirochaetales bacterium]